MPGIDYRRLRREIPISRVLRLVGFEALVVRGDQHRGLCPLPGCVDRLDRRAFSVNVSRNAFRCHRCGSQGNQLSLWSCHLGVTEEELYTITLSLCNALGHPVPWQS